MEENTAFSQRDFIGLILPEGTLEYFNFVKCTYDSDSMCIHLEEKDVVPEEYKTILEKSAGFHDARYLKDFPIRGKKVTLCIKRRRWQVRFPGQKSRKVSRDWSIIESGTNITAEFAAFLKAISR